MKYVIEQYDTGKLWGGSLYGWLPADTDDPAVFDSAVEAAAEMHASKLVKNGRVAIIPWSVAD